MAEQDRANFEAHMLKLNLCTRLHRHPEAAGGAYRTTTVQRAWEAWQAAIESMAAGWISVDDEMPEPGQTVAFVVRTDPEGSHRHLNGRVLGGRFLLGQGFSVPGLSVDATHWQPLPAPPTPQDPPIAAKAAKETT